MKIIPRCGACEPDADAALLVGDALEATCAHCGCHVVRHRAWRETGGGIRMAHDVFTCVPPEEQPTQESAKA